MAEKIAQNWRDVRDRGVRMLHARWRSATDAAAPPTQPLGQYSQGGKLAKTGNPPGSHRRPSTSYHRTCRCRVTTRNHFHRSWPCFAFKLSVNDQEKRRKISLEAPADRKETVKGTVGSEREYLPLESSTPSSTGNNILVK